MASEKRKKSLFKRWWFWVLIVIIIIIIAAISSGGGSSSNNATSHEPVVSNSTTSNTSVASKPATSQPDFTVKVSGTKGLKFQGDIDVVSSDGSSNSESVSGTVSKTIAIKKAAMISVVLQNQGASGTMDVQVFHQGQLVKESKTSAQYGTVSVATSMY